MNDVSAPHTHILIGGGARTSDLFAMQTNNNPDFLAIEYDRGKMSQKKYRALKKKGKSPLIVAYAKRIWKQIKHLKGTVSLWGWSMGTPVAIEVEKIARKHRSGFVLYIVGICPAVYGGPLDKPLHKEMKWLINLLTGSFFSLGKRTEQALKEIRDMLPGFSHKRWEDRRALLEAISGAVMLAPPKDRPPIFIFYSPEDKVIPEVVTLFVANRAGLTAIPVPGYDHDIPIIDTEGEVLELIKKHVANYFATAERGKSS